MRVLGKVHTKLQKIFLHNCKQTAVAFDNPAKMVRVYEWEVACILEDLQMQYFEHWHFLESKHHQRTPDDTRTAQRCTRRQTDRVMNRRDTDR